MKRVSRLTKGIVLGIVLSVVTAVSVYAAAGIDIEKFVSVDGGETWEDADSPQTGPTVTEGSEVQFSYVITNTGDVPLTYTASDSDFGDLGGGTLEPGASDTFDKAATAVLGQYANVATASADYEGVTYTDEDLAHYYGVAAPESVEIDIKPGSDPNSINLKSKGVVPVALVSTEEFDATAIFEDEPVVNFVGAEAVRWAVEDVDGDGVDDVILHFKTQDLGLDDTSTEGELTIGSSYDPSGNLITSHVGQDTVNIVPKGKSKD